MQLPYFLFIFSLRIKIQLRVDQNRCLPIITNHFEDRICQPYYFDVEFSLRLFSREVRDIKV